jgi:hypothetical protein
MDEKKHMKASVLSRLLFNSAGRMDQPLQSRADQNTRKAESGSQPEKKQFMKWTASRVKAAYLAVSAQTHQIIWYQPKLDCHTAARQKSGPGGIPKPFSRGESQ